MLHNAAQPACTRSGSSKGEESLACFVCMSCFARSCTLSCCAAFGNKGQQNVTPDVRVPSPPHPFLAKNAQTYKL
eukprot:1809810-Amphidinium_carterae.1